MNLGSHKHKIKFKKKAVANSRDVCLKLSVWEGGLNEETYSHIIYVYNSTNNILLIATRPDEELTQKGGVRCPAGFQKERLQNSGSQLLRLSLPASINKCFLSSLTTSVQSRCPSSTKIEQNKVRRDRQTLYPGRRPRTVFPPGQPDQSSQQAGAWGLSCRTPSSCPPRCPLASYLKATTKTVCVKKKKDCVCVFDSCKESAHTFTHVHAHSCALTHHTCSMLRACMCHIRIPLSQAHVCTHIRMHTLSTMYTHAHTYIHHEHTQVHVLNHAHAHICTRAHAHPHRHTHRHTS